MYSLFYVSYDNYKRSDCLRNMEDENLFYLKIAI